MNMRNLFFVLSAMVITGHLLAAGDQEILITDIVSAADRNVWRSMSYETLDGFVGKMLYAPWGLKSRSPVRIPLHCRGRYRIFLGTAGTRYMLGSAPFKMLVRLERDVAPVIMDSEVLTQDAGWWAQLCENEWKVADLDNDVLVVENLHGARGCLAWIRLVPTTDAPNENATPTHEMMATNDAYAPVEHLDELLARIMRFKDSPVKKILFCVGNGGYSFMVPSSCALTSAYDKGALYESEYARDCALSYEMLHRKYPNLLDILADFAHSIGLEFHVSFRTGCTVDCTRFSDFRNAADVSSDQRGVCRSENYCQLWNGRPVARFSYAKQEVQDYFIRFYSEMLTEKVDGINLIWIRALPAMLFEPAFRERFKEEYGEALSSPDDPRVVEMRKKIMLNFHRRVKRLAGGKKVSIFVPSTGEVCESFGLDVKKFAAEGLVDSVLIGDCMQNAQHREAFEDIDFDYFKTSCAGTKTDYRAFLWAGELEKCQKAFSAGAAGVVFWDAAEKPWKSWELMQRMTDADGGRASEWLKRNPPHAAIHPLRKLNGFDAETYPWHVAY